MVNVQIVNMIQQYVDSDHPDTVHGASDAGTPAADMSTIFEVKKTSGGARVNTLFFFNLPFSESMPMVTQALMQFWSGNHTGANPVYLEIRPILEPWYPNGVTWNNRPSVGAVLASGAQTIGAYGQWVFDFAPIIMNAISTGVWYGFEVSAASNSDVYFFSSLYPEFYPTFAISYVQVGGPPDSLYPDGQAVNENKPILSFAYHINDSNLAALEIQITESLTGGVPNWASGTNHYDTGWVSAVSGQLDLGTTAYPGATLAATVYWRARTRDLVGNQSDWSEAATFRYAPVGTVNITAPADGDNISLTPTIEWAFTGGTQALYQIIVRQELNVVLTEVLDTGVISSTDTSFQLPADVLTPPAAGVTGTTVQVELRIWDEEVRSAFSTDPLVSSLYASDTGTYTINSSIPPTGGALDPVTGLSASNVAPWGWVELSWDRSVAPDNWAIYVDGALSKIIPASSAFVSGTHYVTRLYDLAPRIEHYIWVLPQVGGRVSLGPDDPTVYFTPRILSTLLCELDGSNAIFLLNYTRDQDDFSASEVFDTSGDGPPILVSQSRKGKRGSISGILAGSSIPGVSALEESQRWEKLRAGEGRPIIVRTLDDGLVCFVTNTQSQPRADGEGVYYEVSFDYYQVVK